MVADTSHLYHLAACCIHQLTYVRVNAFEVGLTNGLARCFDMEYQMYVEFAQRLCHAFTLLPFQGVDIIFLFHIPRVPLRLPWATRSIGLSARLGYRLPWVGLIAIYMRAKQRIFEENSKRAGVPLQGFEVYLYIFKQINQYLIKSVQLY